LKFNINKIYKDRIEQIDIDLKKQYYRGKRKDKHKIYELLSEKDRLLKLLD
jgi:hypothetical protein